MDQVKAYTSFWPGFLKLCGAMAYLVVVCELATALPWGSYDGLKAIVYYVTDTGILFMVVGLFLVAGPTRPIAGAGWALSLFASGLLLGPNQTEWNWDIYPIAGSLLLVGLLLFLLFMERTRLDFAALVFVVAAVLMGLVWLISSTEVFVSLASVAFAGASFCFARRILRGVV